MFTGKRNFIPDIYIFKACHGIIARVSNSKKSKDYHSYYIHPKYFFSGKKSVYYQAVYEHKHLYDNNMQK